MTTIVLVNHHTSQPSRSLAGQNKAISNFAKQIASIEKPRGFFNS